MGRLRSDGGSGCSSEDSESGSELHDDSGDGNDEREKIAAGEGGSENTGILAKAGRVRPIL